MQNEDEGWGLHIEGPSTMFCMCLGYVFLRLQDPGSRWRDLYSFLGKDVAFSKEFRLFFEIFVSYVSLQSITTRALVRVS